MERVLVVGAGFMGSGIAQVCAQAGYRVHLMDLETETLDQAIGSIRWSLKKLSEKGVIRADFETILERVTPEVNLAAAAGADWVIEAVPEIEGLKLEIFTELDRLAPSGIPLATNTSSIPVSRIAEATRHPGRVLGLHFFGPVPLMKLVEVVKGQKTSADIFDRGAAFIRTLGKTPLRVRQDIPGFVMNRIFGAAFKEALALVEKGVVTPGDVDTGMRLGYGWHSGPFEIADNAGLDTLYLVGRSMAELGAAHLAADSDLIERMVKTGRLGKKVGRGFYRYTPDGKRVPGEVER